MRSRPRAVGLSLVGLLALCAVFERSGARAAPPPMAVVSAPTTLEVMELTSIYQEIVAVRSELRKKRVALALVKEKERAFTKELGKAVVYEERIVLEERIAYLVRLEAALLADAAPLKAKVGPVKGPIKLIPLPPRAPAERKKGP